MLLSILLLRCKIKKRTLTSGTQYRLEISRPDKKRQELAMRSMIPAEVALWHSKENTTITRSFYSPDRSWSTSVQNAAFFILIVVTNSWRIPRKIHSLSTVRGSSSVPFPHFHEGAVTRHSSMLGNESHMESSFPFCRNFFEKRNIYCDT